MKRVITALILISMVFGLMALDYYFVYDASLSIFAEGTRALPIFSDIFVLAFVCVAMYEMYHCFKSADYKLFKLPYIVFGLLVYPAFFVAEYFFGQGVFGVLLVFLLSMVIELGEFTFAPSETHLSKDLFAGSFILVYPALFMSLAWILSAKFGGVYVIMFAVFLPIGADTLAFWFGSSLHNKFPKKLCPTISPKKTVVGAVGGAVGSVIAAMAFWAFFEIGAISDTANMSAIVANCGYTQMFEATQMSDLWRSGLVYAAIGVLGVPFSEIGDLAASRIKRSLGVKDYGKIFPGHGGVMDRLDSIMFALVLLGIVLSLVYYIPKMA